MAAQVEDGVLPFVKELLCKGSRENFGASLRSFEDLAAFFQSMSGRIPPDSLLGALSIVLDFLKGDCLATIAASAEEFMDTIQGYLLLDNKDIFVAAKEIVEEVSRWSISPKLFAFLIYSFSHFVEEENEEKALDILNTLTTIAAESDPQRPASFFMFDGCSDNYSNAEFGIRIPPVVAGTIGHSWPK
uniref:Uncharacterized protein n=1 Tax=Palpitomonas bilix TaxID=652834 RepID=A0A7S3G3H2_9EUKA